MIRGLYTAALGMTTQMKKMDVLSNNIANVSTTGYKKDGVVTRSFHDEYMKRLDDKSDLFHEASIGTMQPGTFADDVFTDFSSGSLRITSGAFDLALIGSGFFVIGVSDNNGNQTEMYTRDGTFTLTPDNILVTKEGNTVLGQNGQIKIPLGNVVIDERGNVYSNGNYVDRIRTVDAENPQSLRKLNDNLYTATGETIFKPFTNTVYQGGLENSNVNAAKEMVDLITVSRVYEANAKVIAVHDSTLAKAVSEIARK